MKYLRIIRRCFSFSKYPRYLTHLYINIVLQRIWRARGINLGQGISWLGRPILTLARQSYISIGGRSILCSRASQTALGVNHPVILVTLRAGAKILIGSGVRMSGTTICAAQMVTIGDRCVIGANVTIVDTDFHSLDASIRTTSEDANFAAVRPVQIGDDVFLGGGCMVLKGVTIENEAVIGAGSVVTRNVARGMIVAGNPAKPIGTVKSRLSP